MEKWPIYIESVPEYVPIFRPLVHKGFPSQPFVCRKNIVPKASKIALETGLSAPRSVMYPLPGLRKLSLVGPQRQIGYFSNEPLVGWWLIMADHHFFRWKNGSFCLGKIPIFWDSLVIDEKKGPGDPSFFLGVPFWDSLAMILGVPIKMDPKRGFKKQLWSKSGPGFLTTIRLIKDPQWWTSQK